MLFHWVFPFYGWSAPLIWVFINTHLFSLSVSSTAAADSTVLGQVKFFSTSNQRWFMALIMMKFHLSHSRSLRRLLIKQHSISPSSSATHSATSSPHPMKLKGDNQIAWLWCTTLCYIFWAFPSIYLIFSEAVTNSSKVSGFNCYRNQFCLVPVGSYL